MGKHEKGGTHEGCFACLTGSPWKSRRAKSRASSQNEPCTSLSRGESAVITATSYSLSPPTTRVVPPEDQGHNKSMSSISPSPVNKEQPAPTVLGLWAQAAETLDSTEREALEALMGSTKGIASDHVESVLSTAQRLNEGEGNHPVRSFTIPNLTRRHVLRADTLHRSSTASSTQPRSSRISVTP